MTSRDRALRVVLFLFLAGCGGSATAMPVSRNGRDATGPAAPVAVAARAIELGVIDDALSPGDPRDDSGHHQRAYRIDLDPSQRVRFRVPAGALDPVLRVEGPDGFRIENIVFVRDARPANGACLAASGFA